MWRKWLDRRLKIADHTVQQFSEDGTNDAEILVCCAVSALAAYIWPGRGIDRERYTEPLVKLANSNPQMTATSVPTLANALEDEGAHAGAKAQMDKFYPVSHALVLTSPDMDQNEAAVLALLPSLPKRVDVRFIAEQDGTRVELEHRRFERLGPIAFDVAAQFGGGWPRVLGAFAEHVLAARKP